MSSFYGNGGGSNNGSSGFVSTPDWNQNDPNGDGYIANRPFYVAGEINIEIVNNGVFSFDNSNLSTNFITLYTENILEILKNGAEFTAYYDGTYYSGETINKDGYYFIGNCSLVPMLGMTSEDNIDMPFLFMVMIDNTPVVGGLVLKDSYTGEKNISVSIKTLDVHKIDSKYLPDSKFDLSDRMAKGVDNNGNVVEGAVIEGLLVDKEITTPGGTFTIPKNKAIGDYSHAGGYQTTASGEASHAEGDSTTARGYASHAEGYQTTARGDYSHAEGFSTIANHASQHIFGEFNVADPSTNLLDQRGTYVEIVGNGSDNNNRSNARTLDWSGNERLAGSLTLGMGTGDETTMTAAQLKTLLSLASAEGVEF